MRKEVMGKEDIEARNAAREVRIKIVAAQQLLKDALRDVSTPEHDFIACRAHMEAASDVLPAIGRDGEVL